MGMAAVTDASLVEKLTSYFMMVDIDGGGTLSTEEIQHMLVASHAFTDVRVIKNNVSTIMNLLDPHGRNGITLSEFQDGLLQYPEVVKIFDRCFGTFESDKKSLKNLEKERAEMAGHQAGVADIERGRPVSAGPA